MTGCTWPRARSPYLCFQSNRTEVETGRKEPPRPGLQAPGPREQSSKLLAQAWRQRCRVAHRTEGRSGISNKRALWDKWELPQKNEHPGAWQKSPRKEPWGAWPVPNPTVCQSSHLRVHALVTSTAFSVNGPPLESPLSFQHLVSIEAWVSA